MSGEHKIFRNKMKKSLVLLDDPILAQHVPDTSWFSSSNLYDMLEKHTVIYIKPNTGKQGNRIIRVKKIDKDTCRISYDGKTIETSIIDLETELDEIMKKKKNYIIMPLNEITFLMPSFCIFQA